MALTTAHIEKDLKMGYNARPHFAGDDMAYVPPRALPLVKAVSQAAALAAYLYSPIPCSYCTRVHDEKTCPGCGAPHSARKDK